MQFYRDESATTTPTDASSSSPTAESTVAPIVIEENIPTFKRLGILRLLYGVFSRVIRKKNALEGLMLWFKDIRRNSMRIEIFRLNVEITQDPMRAHQVLVTDWLNHPKTKWEHSVLSPAMEGGLILLQGEKWRVHRMMMAELFSPTVIQELAHAVSVNTLERVKHWKSEHRMNWTHEIQCILNQSMFTTFFDHSPQPIDHLSHQLVKIEKAVEARVFNPLLRIGSHFSNRTGAGQAMDSLSQVIHPSQNTSSRCPYHRMLNLFRSRRLSSKEMVQEGLTLVCAGATNVHLLSWCGYLLGTHPDVQEKLFDEVSQFFEEHQSIQNASILELEKLTYLTAVIQEGLRLYPPAPFLLRHREEKGSFVFIPIWTMHRNSQYWADASSFQPERWINVEGKLIHHESYLPFGAGPRVCIGKRFAMAEARVFLAEVIRQFRIRYTDKKIPKPITTVLTRPRKQVHVFLEQRV